MEEPIYICANYEYKLLQINDPRFVEIHCIGKREAGELPWTILSIKECSRVDGQKWFDKYRKDWIVNAKRRP